MGEAKRRARDAGHDENAVPGTHGPVSDRSAHIMKGTMETLKRAFPDCDFAMFVFEPAPPGARNHARYNYAATVARPDMVAVLKAFIARNDEMAAIDAAIAEPAKGRA